MSGKGGRRMKERRGRRIFLSLLLKKSRVSRIPRCLSRVFIVLDRKHLSMEEVMFMYLRMETDKGERQRNRERNRERERELFVV